MNSFFQKPKPVKRPPRKAQWNWELVNEVTAKQAESKAKEQQFTDAIAAADQMEASGNPELAAQMRYDALFS